jgi:hypothetical protein
MSQARVVGAPTEISPGRMLGHAISPLFFSSGPPASGWRIHRMASNDLPLRPERFHDGTSQPTSPEQPSVSRNRNRQPWRLIRRSSSDDESFVTFAV